MNGRQFYKDRMNWLNRSIKKSRQSLRLANFCTEMNLTLRSSFFRIRVFKLRMKKSILIGNCSSTWTGRTKRRFNKKSRKGLNFAIWPKLAFINLPQKRLNRNRCKGLWNVKNKKNFVTVFCSFKRVRGKGACKNECKSKPSKILITSIWIIRNQLKSTRESESNIKT